MKIPAIRAKIGTWTYYVTTLTFEQVTQNVSKVDDELHKSESLKELIQRSITNNFVSIKDYILKQQEMFFNALVLAVYDDYPNWSEIEVKYGEGKGETYQLGLLDFPGTHKIFPIDGQHRVEGIRAALIENPKMGKEHIAAIFVGHKNDNSGMQKSRRLFSTLNRYAKPVTMDDIIALDEDDSAAIITRELLEEYDLFTGKRVVYAKQKAIPQNNKDALTSIITLYQANVELFKDFYFRNYGKRLKKPKLEEQLKFRPTEGIYKEYKAYCLDYWNAFSTLTVIKEYLKKEDRSAEPYRNSEIGGNLIFRPIGFLPLVKASIRIKEKKKATYKSIFKRFDSQSFEINRRPWLYVLWNPIEKKMIMNSSSITELLLLYLYDEKNLTKEELTKLKEGYAASLSIESPSRVKTILSGLR